MLSVRLRNAEGDWPSVAMFARSPTCWDGSPEQGPSHVPTACLTGGRARASRKTAVQIQIDMQTADRAADIAGPLLASRESWPSCIHRPHDRPTLPHCKHLGRDVEHWPQLLADFRQRLFVVEIHEPKISNAPAPTEVKQIFGLDISMAVTAFMHRSESQSDLQYPAADGVQCRIRC